MNAKIIKDNIHDYITIEIPFFKIIDTAVFQRLKNIKQTSYVSLYPSSTHDRFTHSLGVFYLGTKAIDCLENNIKNSQYSELIDKNLTEYVLTFRLACLLHDVGHSPFSHTGENFYYLKKYDKTTVEGKFFQKIDEAYEIEMREIDTKLILSICNYLSININTLDLFSNTLIGKEREIKDFIFDFAKVIKTKSAKPHEIISVIISLDNFKLTIDEICNELNSKFDPILFTRCIIGALHTILTAYPEEQKINIGIKNAIIQLLNSSIIDVDKLDYFGRDRYMTGYKTVEIDIERLIKSFTLLKNNNEFKLGYKKSAFSIIENVILASDLLKRWVQTHPIILYDVFVTQKALSDSFQLFKECDSKNRNIFERFFSLEALGLNGKELFNEEKFFLVSDLDAIYLLKKAYLISIEKGKNDTTDIIYQFFARDARRHSLWKSELEFNVCFNMDKLKSDESKHGRFNEIIDCINAFIAYKNENGLGNVVINDKLIQKIDKGETSYSERTKKFLKELKKYFDKNKLDFDLVILNCDAFESCYKKLNGNNVYIEMPDYTLAEWQSETAYTYNQLTSVNEIVNKCKDVFYFYSKAHIETKDFINFLLNKIDLTF